MLQLFLCSLFSLSLGLIEFTKFTEKIVDRSLAQRSSQRPNSPALSFSFRRKSYLFFLNRILRRNL